MNGLEFALCTTAEGATKVLVHAAPERMVVDTRTDKGSPIAGGELDREGEYSPMTLLELSGEELRRSEIWPAHEHLGLPVLLAGGEVGILLDWRHGEDHKWWRWSVEFSNEVG